MTMLVPRDIIEKAMAESPKNLLRRVFSRKSTLFALIEDYGFSTFAYDITPKTISIIMRKWSNSFHYIGLETKYSHTAAFIVRYMQRVTAASFKDMPFKIDITELMEGMEDSKLPIKEM